MSPFRWDVLLVGFVLAVPVLALGLRGDLTAEEVMTRMVWCLLAGWVVVALLRWATTPPTPAPAGRRTPVDPDGDGDGDVEAQAHEDQERSAAP